MSRLRSQDALQRRRFDYRGSSVSGYEELTAADLAHRWRERTPLEYIDEVASLSADEEYKDKKSALQWLLYLSWHALKDAQRTALNGSWSIQCESEVRKIVNLTRLVGPISWDRVPCEFVVNGIYERIHTAMGVSTPVSDSDRADAQAVIDRRVR